MRSKFILVFLAALLASCSWSENGAWKLIESGYSIDAPYSEEFAFRMHVNQLKQLGGDVKDARFRLFVAERLKREGVCARGWQPLPCTEDGSCVSRTRTSVTVYGRCIDP